MASFAAAYSLGNKQESAAAVNLMRMVPKDVKESLTLLVRLPNRYKSFLDVVCLLEFKNHLVKIESIEI